MTPPCVVPTFRPYTVENLEFGGFYASSCESRVRIVTAVRVTQGMFLCARSGRGRNQWIWWIRWEVSE